MDIYPANPLYGYHACTDGYYTSPQLVVELLGVNMVTTVTVMPSRKEMPDLLERKNRDDDARGCAVIHKE
jgi:hypothetical protein